MPARFGARLLLGGGAYKYVIASNADIAALNALGTVPSGTRIGIRRGSVLSSSLTLIGNNVLVEAFGSGAMPYIDCRDALSAGGWTATVGHAGVFQRTVTLPADASNLGNVWEDENFLTQVTAIPSVAGTSFMSDWTSASPTLYIFPSDSGDPASNGKAYRYSARKWGISLTGTNCTIRGIKSRGNAHQAGSIFITGTGSSGLIDQCRMEDGNRHCSVSAAAVRYTNNYFYRAKNDLEAATPANFITWNETDISARSIVSSGNTYDAGGLGFITAMLAHDDVNGQKAISATHTNETFIGCVSSWADYATATNIVNPVLSASGFGTMSHTGATLTVTNPQGTIGGFSGDTGQGNLITAQGSGHYIVNGGSITIAKVGAGCVNSSSTSADFNLTLSGTTVAFTALGTSNFQAFVINRGTLTLTNSIFTPTLVCPFVTFAKVGVGATGNLVSSGCTFPYGVNGIINGTTYKTLELLQSNGFDSGSARGSRTTTFSDTFNRANGNISVGDSWTLKSGNAGAYQVQSNQLRMQNVADGAYGAPTSSSADQWAEGTIQATSSSGKMPLALNVADTSNLVGVAWSVSQYQYKTRIAAASGQPLVSSGFTPTVADKVCVAKRGDLGVIYVNDAIAVGPGALSATALTAQNAGMYGGGGAIDPIMDNYSCGPT